MTAVGVATDAAVVAVVVAVVAAVAAVAVVVAARTAEVAAVAVVGRGTAVVVVPGTTGEQKLMDTSRHPPDVVRGEVTPHSPTRSCLLPFRHLGDCEKTDTVDASENHAHKRARRNMSKRLVSPHRTLSKCTLTTAILSLQAFSDC